MPEQEQKEIKYLVRIVNTDLDGRKHVLYALNKIKGVSTMFANAVCRVASINPTSIIGNLSDDVVKKLSAIVSNPEAYKIPSWMFNRRKDPETGKDKHLLTNDLQFSVENDIKIMKKIKSYKGVRHMLGQPVRGQRTRSHFRRNKGKVHLGVKRSATAKKGGRV